MAKAKKKKAKRAKVESVLVLRCFNNKARRSRNDFQYPKKGVVSEPSFDGKKLCGCGLHGWPWGRGDRGVGTCDFSWTRIMRKDGTHHARQIEGCWMVLRVPVTYRGKINFVTFGGKCKFGRGVVVKVGTYGECTRYIAKRTPATIIRPIVARCF